MSGHWVQDCKRILDQIKKLEHVKGDRLDMVRTIRFTLYALQRSVSGWMEWINNPEVMASFSHEELEEISKNISQLTQPFVEYDCKITSHAHKKLAIVELEKRRESAKKPKDKKDIFYVK